MRNGHCHNWQINSYLPTVATFPNPPFILIIQKSLVLCLLCGKKQRWLLHQNSGWPLGGHLPVQDASISIVSWQMSWHCKKRLVENLVFGPGTVRQGLLFLYNLYLSLVSEHLYPIWEVFIVLNVFCGKQGSLHFEPADLILLSTVKL
jgi:hypothetical protein